MAINLLQGGTRDPDMLWLAYLPWAPLGGSFPYFEGLPAEAQGQVSMHHMNRLGLAGDQPPAGGRGRPGPG